ncbi:MAG: putative Ig domain-containing protein [Myxococcota bacterium]
MKHIASLPVVAFTASLMVLLGAACSDAPSSDGDVAPDDPIPNVLQPSTSGGNGGSSSTDPADPDGGGDDGGGDSSPGDGPTGNVAPELTLIGDRIVAVGEDLVIDVQASDANGDPLTYSVYGELPEGSKFDKIAHRFEWTPDQAGQTVYLTFVVSDSSEFDRETVRIQVVADKEDHPPEFILAGDQTVVAGQLFTLQLAASDPDGDVLSYGYQGLLPEGGSLDPDTGLFSWTAGSDLIGETFEVTFTVGDGSLQDVMPVILIVQEEGGGGGGPSPPIFAAIGGQQVAAGEELVFVISAVDADGDKLTYDAQGELPEGALLDVATFRWTPEATHIGQVFQVLFSATDGTYVAYLNVEITVTAIPDGTCIDDTWEPNEDIDGAYEIEPGEYSGSICDTDLVPVDYDFFKMTIPEGETLTVTLAFDTVDGDLDLFLVNEAIETIASSETTLPLESVTWTAPETTELYILVLGFGQPVFAAPYELTISTSDELPLQCLPDAFEPNENASQAKLLDDGLTGLSLCEDDVDVWKTSLICGETLQVTMNILGQGDLDMGLWSDASLQTEPIAQAATASETEQLALYGAPDDGTYYLKVVGYPPGQSWSPYELDVTRSGGCEDDEMKGNVSVATAHPLGGNDGQFAEAMICCDNDWYSFALGANQHALIEATVAEGTIALEVYDSDGLTKLSMAGPSQDAVQAEIESGASATYYLRVQGTVSALYDLEWIVIGGTAAQCTSSKDCPKYNVCDVETGDCVSDFCLSESGCPTGFECIDTYCVDPCDDDAACRTNDGYLCKSFEEGTFCGVAGSSGPGESCGSHVTCADAAACLFQGDGGYCAIVGCSSPQISCPIFSACLNDDDFSYCAKTCQTDAQCRPEDGFTCSEGTCSSQ